MPIRDSIESFVFANKSLFVQILVGLLLLGIGLFLYKSELLGSKTKVEVVESSTDTQKSDKVVVEISGAVEKPGVYELLASERVERLLIASGGLSVSADREWVSKNLNRAAKLVDGQKIYVPKEGEVKIGGSVLGGLGKLGGLGSMININTASVSELDSLEGIGQVRAQKIIDNRPYSSIEELLSKKVLPKEVFEKIKDKIVAP